jgi:nucleoside phosphorylase
MSDGHTSKAGPFGKADSARKAGPPSKAGPSGKADSPKAFRRYAYTIGWICALKEEIAAAQAMLDHIHSAQDYKDPLDQNSYTLGQIRKHNVVIVSLPAGIYGTNAAATVANNMIRTFPSIKVCLMVGVAGGVPSKENDIRLGDIVVSQPTGTSSGVIQYDLGKAIAGGKFKRTGQLNSPPFAVLTALNQLKAKHELKDSQVSEFIHEMLRKYPKMTECYSHRGQANDHLFEVMHRGSLKEIRRARRKDTIPRIFYGSIASGNQVIKDGPKRERLWRELRVLCCEMEAAGVLVGLPCLVIRGICDYCDSHKNKDWQPYAAATAAAFAKELLVQMVPEKVREEMAVGEISGR